MSIRCHGYSSKPLGPKQPKTALELRRQGQRCDRIALDQRQQGFHEVCDWLKGNRGIAEHVRACLESGRGVMHLPLGV